MPLPTSVRPNGLQVDTQGVVIVITMPGTKFVVAYEKPKGSQRLVAKSDWIDDPNARVTLVDFRARAQTGVDRVNFASSITKLPELLG